ncbi:MAG TPA: PP2C family protein-serine/threonine phosphatase [Bacteroidota bacterium]|nr:PP2C family protein-serine/threonine phosphatase [Bacteroidota bacterium]
MSGAADGEVKIRENVSLEAAFRSLAGAATAAELVARLHAALVSRFGAPVRIARSAGGNWEMLAGEPGPLPPADCAPGPAAEAGMFRVVRPMPDGSRLCAAVTRDEAGEEGLAALGLFVTLYESVLREILARRHEKELIFSLNHRVLQLNSLIDTGIEVASLECAAPHHVALERAASLTNAARGVLRVLREGRTAEEVTFPHGSPAGAGGARAGTISSRFEFGGDRYEFTLIDKESRQGPSAFDGTDQLLLDALARQVMASLENRYLHRQELEKQRIEQDIAVAASIQQRILPKALPRIAGYDIAGVNIPSRSVGGDYYDCIPLPGGRLALVIADVAGKGVPAALLVSSFHAYLSAFLEAPVAPAALAARLNNVVVRTATEDKFITAFFAVLDPHSGALEAVSAGHNPVFLRTSGGAIRELSTGGIPLGMLDMEYPYQSETVTLEKGDRLLLYTDGVTEASDEKDRMYDASAPLREFVAGHLPDRAETFIGDLIADVKRFTGKAPQNDDITALYLMRT